MRIMPILILLYLSSACSTEARIESNGLQDGLLGSVSTIRIEKNLLSEADGSREITQVGYNNKGDKTEETKYKADGSLLNKTVFTYDESGQLSESTVFKADGSIYLKRIRKSIRAIEGGKTEESVFGGGTTLLSKAITVYDKKRRAAEFATYDANGASSIKQVITYNAQDSPAEINYFQHGTDLMGKVIFSYDAQGNQTEHVEYDAAGVRGSKYVFTGDLKRGSQIETAEYDGKDNLVNKERYVREFDSHGNWIKETKSKLNLQSGKFEPVEVTRRIITYY